MKVAPFRALTQFIILLGVHLIPDVEMKVAHFRASTQRSPAKQNKAIFHVEARPTQGIQTNHKKTSELSPQIRKLAGPFLLYSWIR